MEGRIIQLVVFSYFFGMVISVLNANIVHSGASWASIHWSSTSLVLIGRASACLVLYLRGFSFGEKIQFLTIQPVFTQYKNVAFATPTFIDSLATILVMSHLRHNDDEVVAFAAPSLAVAMRCQISSTSENLPILMFSTKMSPFTKSQDFCWPIHQVRLKSHVS